MPALIALLDAAAESRRAALADVAQRFSLLARQYRIPTRQEILLMSADDIGQLGPMRFHGWIVVRSSPSESSGLGVERIATSATCK